MRNAYKSPLQGRYASNEMLYLFSEDKKFKTWRKLWVILAETEHELGLNGKTPLGTCQRNTLTPLRSGNNNQ